MSRLNYSHPIVKVLKRSKNVSQSLSREFIKFLSEFNDWESQARYLLEDKGDSIEEIIEALYDVPIKQQLRWKKPKTKPVFEEASFDQFSLPPDATAKGKNIVPADYYPQYSFKDWKQEHGFDSIPVEVGDIHTIIRFQQVYSKEREEKFIWMFNRARYGIRGWGNEKPIKSISKSLLDNNNNPGWVIKTFLDENRLLTDEYGKINTGTEIPNPLILSSRDTHALIFLLLGHPFTFYGTSTLPIHNSFKKVEFDVNVHVLSNHRILAGIFLQEEDGNLFPIITEEFVDKGLILYGLPKSIIFDSSYFEILPTPIPASMIRDSFKGILIPNDEWRNFTEKWQAWYPEKKLEIMDPKKVDPPHFEARQVKDWKYWLTMPESKVDLFNSKKDITHLVLHDETKRFNTNRLAIDIENYNGSDSKLKNPSSTPKAAKLFQVIDSIFHSKKVEDYFSVERYGASQLLMLAEEYPYALNFNRDMHMISPGSLDFRITVIRNPKNENQYLLKGEIGQFDKKKKFKPLFNQSGTPPKAIGMVPAFILKDDQLVRVASMLSGRLINDTVSGVIVEESEISDFYTAALPYLRQRNIQIHDPQGVLRVSALFNYKLKGKMTIWEVKGILIGRLDTVMVTGIGELPYPLDVSVDEFEQTLDKKSYKIPKDFNQEKKLKEEMLEHGWIEEGDGDYSMREDCSMRFVMDILPSQSNQSMLIYLGATKLRRWKTKQLVPIISTSIKSGIDWFDVDVSMTIDGELFDLKKLVSMWKNDEQAIELTSGEGVAVINSDWISRYAPILNRLIQTSKDNDDDPATNIEKILAETEAEEKEQSLKIDKFQIGLLSELESIASYKTSDDEWTRILKKVSSFKGIKNQRIPKEINGTLRGYQKDGVNWLSFLDEFGFGGILADDMGLGKTMQTLVFLAILKKKKPKKPNIVIAPTSVVTNWMAEVEKFVPHFKAVLLHGQKRKEHFDEAIKSDLIITTYGLLQRDLEWLRSIDFQVIILDEAQNIKNARSKTAQAVTKLNGSRRLALTGTPIENSVMELWSQFNFLMPGFFGSMREFERDYIKPRGSKGLKKKRPDHGLLRRQTRPFILRRLKQDVAKELPPKTEQTLFCEMNDNQKKLYNSILEIVRQQVQERISAGGIKGAKIAIFDALLKLRQICCDPRLSSLSGTAPPPSAKFNLFIQTISEIIGEGHRVLVFSQFVKMLNLMHNDLEKLNIPYLQLDGSSKNRDALVAKFQQSDAYPVFLISLKAGGTGINLTAADYVIHYDPWWNPAVEAQATDRAYRIGQKNRVLVYKLITRNSIEEKIVELQKKKQLLADNIVGVSDTLEQMLNMDDISDLFMT
ncbi:MAG: DEAD/DEAH box helicase [SAR324 cluster bacterium]|nr:DEAD/DEAH box helicase [SAR324 cluster bacterium]